MRPPDTCLHVYKAAEEHSSHCSSGSSEVFVTRPSDLQLSVTQLPNVLKDKAPLLYRLLCECARYVNACANTHAPTIHCCAGDPLYGNLGGDDERAAVREVAGTLREACEGFVSYLQQLQATGSTQHSLREKLADSVNGMKAIEWLVPPMLQKR